MFVRKYCLIFGSLFLAACTHAPQIGQQSPQEVLRLAARASQELESAQYTAEVQFEQEHPNASSNGEATVDGVLQKGGDQMEAHMDLSVEGVDAGADYSFTGLVDLIMGAGSELYVRLSSVSVTPENLLQPELLSNFEGTWWLFPSQQPTDAAVTPSPGLIRAQAEIVDVINDRGTTTVNGRSAYRYAVQLNRERLFDFMLQNAQEQGEALTRDDLEKAFGTLEGEGELLIDTETFFLHQLLWDIENTEQDGSTMKMHIAVHLSGHNEAPDITPPADAQEFSPFSFMNIPLPDEQTGYTDPSFSDDEAEMLMKLLEDPSLLEQ